MRNTLSPVSGKQYLILRPFGSNVKKRILARLSSDLQYSRIQTFVASNGLEQVSDLSWTTEQCVHFKQFLKAIAV